MEVAYAISLGRAAEPRLDSLGVLTESHLPRMRLTSSIGWMALRPPAQDCSAQGTLGDGSRTTHSACRRGARR